jgi:type IV pilus assembly protein PilQ
MKKLLTLRNVVPAGIILLVVTGITLATLSCSRKPAELSNPPAPASRAAGKTTPAPLIQSPAIVSAPVPASPPDDTPSLESAITPLATGTPVPTPDTVSPLSTPTASNPADANPSSVADVTPAELAVPAAIAPKSAGKSDPIAGPGQSLTEFQDQDLDTVLRLLARQAKINMAISDKVSGKITMRIENLTPLEAINMVARSKNLVVDKIEGIYYVKTGDERTKEPTESGNYTLSYAQADKISELLKGILVSGAAPQSDMRTNTIYFREVQSNMPKIMEFLKNADVPTRQVMIEARLVEVTAQPLQSYGVNWAGVVGSASSPQVVTYGATSNTNGSSGSSGSSSSSGGGGTTTSTGPFALGDATSTNFLKSLTHLGSLATGQVAILSVPQMSVAMQFLNEDSDAEFLANPRIVAANGQKATIKITRNQPVPQLNFNEQTATAVFGGFSDKNYGNTLVVTPNINKDGFINLVVQPEISNKVADASFTFSGATVTSPIIDTRTLDSNVLIKSGDTLAIGGLLQDEVTKTSNKVPLLGDIPGIGYMFQSHQNARTKRNLLIFVTPTIINPGTGTGLEEQAYGLHNSGNEYANPTGWRNNAKGAIRVVPANDKPLAAQYPAPSPTPKPAKMKVRKATLVQLPDQSN